MSKEEFTVRVRYNGSANALANLFALEILDVETGKEPEWDTSFAAKIGGAFGAILGDIRACALQGRIPEMIVDTDLSKLGLGDEVVSAIIKQISTGREVTRNFTCSREDGVYRVVSRG